MADSKQPTRVLAKVGGRLRLARLGRRWAFWTLVLAAVTIGLVATTRLTGIGPGAIAGWFGFADAALPEPSWSQFAGIVVGGVLVIAGLISLARFRRPSDADAARRIDQHHGTKDLFLTLTMLDSSAGEFQPLVARDAANRALRIQPQRVVPFRVRDGLVRTVTALAVLILVVWQLPTYDMFGQVAQAEELKKKRATLIAQARKTRGRKTLLEKDDSEGRESPEVTRAIEELMKSLKAMKPTEQKKNQAELSKQRRDLGNTVKKIDPNQLRKALTKARDGQQFGALDEAKLEKWSRELQQGNTDSLKKEMEALKVDLDQLMKADTPEETKRELRNKIKKRLKEMQAFATEKLGTKHPLTAALKRAQKQLREMKSESLSKEAAKHLAETMDLSEMELEQLEQSVKDLKQLEKAMETASMAKKINDQSKLDGELVENAATLDDYRELYAQMMAEMGDARSESDGTGNKGFGKGGEVPEDDSAETGFKTEISKSALSAGKVLLTMKTKGQSDKGDARQAYRKNLRTVTQAVDEAIEKEEIPTGYQAGIRKYFKSLDDELADERPAKPDAPE